MGGASVANFNADAWFQALYFTFDLTPATRGVTSAKIKGRVLGANACISGEGTERSLGSFVLGLPSYETINEKV